jgi:hypothetical protein
MQASNEGVKEFSRSSPTKSIPQILTYVSFPDLYVVPLLAGQPAKSFVVVEVGVEIGVATEASEAVAAIVVVAVVVVMILELEEFLKSFRRAELTNKRRSLVDNRNL